MWPLPLLTLLLSSLAHAQLLPSTQFLPPDSSNGAIPSNSTSIPNPQWSTLLGNLLYFYDAQRSGNISETSYPNRVSWRNDSAVTDGQDVGLDLSGGYYDAGDYIKATFPLSFTLMSICWGATDFGQGYDLANQTAYLDEMLRWGLDWLMRAHPENSTLYVQVADGNTDDAYWGGDLNIPLPRPSYQINDTNPGTDAAAGASAAFSACSNLYSSRSFSPTTFTSPASLSNTTYASLLLSHATSLYSFALNATGGLTLYQTSTPIVSSSYGSSAYTDELTIAALFLAWATNSSELYRQAERDYTNFSLGGEDGVFNWDSKTPGIAVLFAQMEDAGGMGGTGNLSVWQEEAERYFDHIVNDDGPAFLTKGGLLFYNGDSDDATLNPALNAAMLLTRYAPLATSETKRTNYLNYAKTQLDYALGKNPMSVPYIVGSNPNSPSNQHSAMASGGDDISNIDTSPAQEAYILYGAVVGGPNKHDKFYDIRSDWPETEVALDYNAPMLTLAAMHVLNDTSDPYFTSLSAGAYESVRPSGEPCDAAFTSHCGTHLSKGGKIGVGVAVGVVGLVIVALLGWYLWTHFHFANKS